MSTILRIILISSSFLAFYLCIRKTAQSKLKMSNAITWLVGCIILIIMSIFTDAVSMLSNKLGFVAPVNFVFLIISTFLLIQVFIDNINITELNEKIKDLNHYIALKENDEERKRYGEKK